MTDNNLTNEQPVQVEYVVVSKPKRRWYHRSGCMIGLLIWLIVILTPSFFIVMAIQGEITIHHTGDVPDKIRHPRFQIKLIMEPDYRGFSITTSSIHRDSDDALCIQNNVHFLLWQGSGEATSYCQCYTRSKTVEGWEGVEISPESCS